MPLKLLLLNKFLTHLSSSIRRFYNDRETKTDSFNAHYARDSHPSHHHHSVLIEPDIHDANHNSLVSQLLVSRPNSSHSSHHSLERPASRHTSQHERSASRHAGQLERSSSRYGSQFRVISDLLPSGTTCLHHPSCTCYQCQVKISIITATFVVIEKTAISLSRRPTT